MRVVRGRGDAPLHYMGRVTVAPKVSKFAPERMLAVSCERLGAKQRGSQPDVNALLRFGRLGALSSGTEPTNPITI